MGNWLLLLGGILIVVILLLIAGILYLNRWAQFYVNAAVDRGNDWFATEGAALFDQAWQKRTDEEDEADATFWLQEKTWKITSEDRLKLVAATFTQPGHRWVIALHGYRSTGFQDMNDVAQVYYEKGYNVLVPDLRGHGRSEGQTIGLGWLDRLDLLQWIDAILAQDAEAEILLHGCSIGGASALMASGEKLPPQVKLIIADSSFTSVYSEFKWLLRRYTKYPVSRFMVLANRYARRKVGYSLIRASVTRQLGSNHLPILLLHGQEDQFVPVKELAALAKASAGPAETRTFAECGHLEAKEQKATEYWDAVFAFIQQYTK